jgi:hypothetical protein
MSTTCYLHDITHSAKSFAFKVIHDALGGFNVIREWIHQFLKQYMNWTFKVEIIATSKLSNYWDQQQ